MVHWRAARRAGPAPIGIGIGESLHAHIMGGVGRPVTLEGRPPEVRIHDLNSLGYLTVLTVGHSNGD